MQPIGARSFIDDAHLTPQFFKEKGVRLSVELRPCRTQAVPRNIEQPNFFFWSDPPVLYIVDFCDGFHRPLADSLDVALRMLESAGHSARDRCIRWRDALKRWHTAYAYALPPLDHRAFLRDDEPVVQGS